MSATTRAQARQAALLAAGLCRCCGGEKVDLAVTLCTRCADANKVRLKRLRIERRQMGLCTVCGGAARYGYATCYTCAISARLAQSYYQFLLHIEVWEHYGGAFCQCCGETILEFLEIDHIGGGGNLHRRIDVAAKNIYQWLKTNHFPPGFRVLCSNCNQGYRKLGVCPHQRINPLPKLEEEKWCSET